MGGPGGPAPLPVPPSGPGTASGSPKWPWVVGGVVLLLLLPVVLKGAALFRSAGGVSDSADRYLASLEDGDYEAAYRMSCADFRSAIELPGFIMLALSGGGEAAGHEIHLATAADDDVGAVVYSSSRRVEGEVVVDQGVVALRRENGDWKVCWQGPFEGSPQSSEALSAARVLLGSDPIPGGCRAAQDRALASPSVPGVGEIRSWVPDRPPSPGEWVSIKDVDSGLTESSFAPGEPAFLALHPQEDGLSQVWEADGRQLGLRVLSFGSSDEAATFAAGRAVLDCWLADEVGPFSKIAEANRFTFSAEGSSVERISFQAGRHHVLVFEVVSEGEEVPDVGGLAEAIAEAASP